ncbi:MAG: DUF5916 domain-containing protein [Candidatus Latescibacterota bacterium]
MSRQRSTAEVISSSLSAILLLGLLSGPVSAHEPVDTTATATATPVADSTGAAGADTAKGGPHPRRVARAVRCPAAPVIDGRLDDAVWALAPENSGFTQRDPKAGEPMTECTVFRILYDDEALYIGAMLYDREPDRIMARLARRDDWKQRDEFNVNLDPQHDHQTGNFFVVDPSGWMGDGVMWNDGWDDDSWDGVWDARTAILADGWSAELKIPYRVLRFSPREQYTWGLEVMRNIGRKNEWGQWTYIPREVNGWNSRFGHLEGIERIDPPRSLEVFPFGLGRVIASPGGVDGDGDTEATATAGVDLRYALNSGVSLNGTVNPDFGQVEADPAVLNLSVFETFLSERRPFFLEGNSVFETPGPFIVGVDGPTRLFHSRRIGRTPSRFDLPDDGEEVDRPDNTTLLGAMKLSGKTAGHTSFGVLEAVTDEEFARVDQPRVDPVSGAIDTVRRTVRVEPFTSYFVGRMQRDVRTGRTVGAQLTAVNGQDFEPAYVGAVDAQLKWKENAYTVFARLAASQAGQDEDRGEGWEGDFYFSKFSGWIGGQVYADVRSEGFQANDLGYMDRAGRITTGAHLQLRRLEPWRLGRRGEVNLNAWHHRNLDGIELARGVNINLWNAYENDWGSSAGLSHEFRVEDDLNTRGGPVMARPANTSWWVDTWTDDRGAVSGWVSYNGNRGLGGDNQRHRLSGEIGWRPRSNVELEVEPGYSRERTAAQWVDNVDDNGDDEADHYVFGHLDSRTFEIQARGSIAFTPRLSLQAIVQPFVTTGDYEEIKELARPHSFAFIPYEGLEDNPDFSQRSLRANVVLRWEYAPGSTLFAVWQQVHDWELEDADSPNFEPLSGVGRSLTDDGDNILLLKVSRWFGL